MSRNAPQHDDVLSEEALKESFPDYSGQVTASEHVPARDADTVPAEEILRDELAEQLDNDLYRHQAKGLEALADDENIVVTTSTSSGRLASMHSRSPGISWTTPTRRHCVSTR